MDIQDADYWIERPLDSEISDWGYDRKNWVKDYWASIEHPHRKLILEELSKFNWNSLLEIGCNVGINLELIQFHFPLVKLSGVDASAKAINEGINLAAKTINLEMMNFVKEWPKVKADVLLADAVLMYVSDQNIFEVMSQIAKYPRVIILDRFDESMKGVVKNHIWARNYGLLLKKLGYKVKEKKITKKEWPTSIGWQQFGRMWSATK